jgi:hypothetical protein
MQLINRPAAPSQASGDLQPAVVSPSPEIEVSNSAG